MIRQYQNKEILEGNSKDPQKRQKLITYRLDSELINQVKFLAKHLGIKQLEVLRQVVKKEIVANDLWSTYQKSPKKHPIPTTRRKTSPIAQAFQQAKVKKELQRKK